MVKRILGIFAGLTVGFFVGCILPYLLVQATIKESGDNTAAGGMFLIVVTVPICTFFGGFFGYSAGVVWSYARPFNRRMIKKIMSQCMTPVQINSYFTGLKSGYDTEKISSSKDPFIEMGSYDGAKIRAYGSIEKVLKERVGTLKSKKLKVKS